MQKTKIVVAKLMAALLLAALSTSGYCDCYDLAADRAEKCREHSKGDEETIQRCNNKYDSAVDYCGRVEEQRIQRQSQPPQGMIVVPQQQIYGTQGMQ